MDFQVKSNSREISDALAAFIRQYGVGIPKALRYQGRLLADRLIRGPKSTSGGRGIATPPETQAQGKAAVKRDIAKVVQAITPAWVRRNFTNPKVRRALLDLLAKNDARTLEGLQSVFERFKSGSLRDAILSDVFNPAWHHSQRDKRGRVSASKPKLYLTIDSDAVAAYIKKEQGNVGRAKGGWAAALLGLGGKTSKWIEKFSFLGNLEDRADSIAGYIRMTNRSEWASGGDEDRVVENAIQGRIEAIYAGIERAQEKELQSFSA